MKVCRPHLSFVGQHRALKDGLAVAARPRLTDAVCHRYAAHPYVGARRQWLLSVVDVCFPTSERGTNHFRRKWYCARKNRADGIFVGGPRWRDLLEHVTTVLPNVRPPEYE